MMGLESVQILAAPMAGSLEDLEEFWKRIVAMKPWTYDFTVGLRRGPAAAADTDFVALQCVPLPWQPVDLQIEGRKLKWGVIWQDGEWNSVTVAVGYHDMVAELIGMECV